MQHRDYAALSARLERYAAARPRAYQLRVGALALLGYLVLGGALLLVGLVLGGLGYGVTQLRGGAISALLKLSLPLLALAWLILKALWVRLEPPGGRRLARDEAPALFAAVDELRQALRAPPVHRVLLTDDFNASVSQIPRLGVFGWPRNYLCVGLPLLAALTPAQFRAVLAHEFAHLSGAHARFGNWIYRVRATWVQLLGALEARQEEGNGSFAAGWFARFFEWYAPYFSAYSFVLARRHEYEADRLAAGATSAADLGAALVALRLRGEHLAGALWPAVAARTADEARPPRAAFAGVMAGVADALPATAHETLARALRESADPSDTHPSLAQRLEALGIDTTHPAALLRGTADTVATSALRSSLATTAERLVEELDDAWTRQAESWWTSRRERLLQTRSELELLERQAAQGPLSPDDAFRRALLAEELHGADAALPLVHALLAESPDHAPGRFMLGRLLLAGGDAAGLPQLERAMTLDEDAVLGGCSLAAAFLREHDREDEAQTYDDRATVRAALLEAAEAERAGVARSDRLAPVELADAQRTLLLRRLRRHGAVKRAWLVRKEMRHLPQQPMFVLGVDMRRSIVPFGAGRAAAELVQALLRELDEQVLPPDGTVLVQVFGQGTGWLRRAIRRVPDAEIYRG